VKRLSADKLKRLAASLLIAAGASPREAEIVAASLVDANLCGHDSHGVVRIPEYWAQIQSRELLPDVLLEASTETPSILVADAKFGFGQVQCARMIEQLIPKARVQGVASGSMRNCGHVGRLGEWVERIAAEGLVGLLAVNDNGVLRCVAPPGGVQPCISTNPLAIGVPTNSGLPFVLDFSTSAVANGKIRVAYLAGQKCPEGWLQDSEGRPTTDPSARYADPPATILPMGGDQAYKGFGLGLFLDLLTAGLSGGFCSPAPEGAPQTNNVLFVLWDPDRFAGREHLVRECDKLTKFVRSSPRKPWVREIRLPGDRSNAFRYARQNEGIPIDDGTWASLSETARELGVPLPQHAEHECVEPAADPQQRNAIPASEAPLLDSE